MMFNVIYTPLLDNVNENKSLFSFQWKKNQNQRCINKIYFFLLPFGNNIYLTSKLLQKGYFGTFLSETYISSAKSNKNNIVRGVGVSIKYISIQELFSKIVKFLRILFSESFVYFNPLQRQKRKQILSNTLF